MGLTSSLFAGLSGMKTNEFRMDIIGNNIANVNTHSFKSSRATFQSQFYSTFTFGSAPNGSFGGTNPVQVGTGSTIGAVTRNFSGGAPETTGNKTDLAIQGQGLFIVEKPDGANVYTRDGSFQFNGENYLMTADGYFLKGYGVDNNFNILDGTLERLRVPIGEVTTAATTTEAVFNGDLNPDGFDAMTQDGKALSVRPVLDSQTLTDTVTGTLATDSLLVNLDNGNGAFVVSGNIISLTEGIKGGQTLPEASFTVSDTSTLGEFMDWLEGVLGINTNIGDLPVFLNQPDPGVAISAAGDSVEIVGNMGNQNDLTLSNKALKVTVGSAGSIPGDSLPLTFAAPDGFELADVESVRTSFRAYDSVGIPLDIDITLVLESKNSGGGLTWRFFAESSQDWNTSDANNPNRVLGTGTISFDANGNFLEAQNNVITIDRQETGAATPQTITLDFSRMDGFAMNSVMTLLSQDGFMAGTLTDFSIGSDGIIIGSFDNGLTRQLGQVVLATFRNYEGLVALSDNLYSAGPNSGDAIVKKPLDLGAGNITAAALELSNVDLSREFINLIISSTGFSASSRVIQTSDRLLNELMTMTR